MYGDGESGLRDRLRELRTSKGLTQEKLAWAIGVSIATYIRW